MLTALFLLAVHARRRARLGKRNRRNTIRIRTDDLERLKVT
jgi:translation initiation factor IF-1